MIARLIGHPLPHKLTIKPRNLTITARSYVKSVASAGRGPARLYALGSVRKKIEKVSRASTGRIAERTPPPESQTADRMVAQLGDAPRQRRPTILREKSTAVFSAAVFATVKGTCPSPFARSLAGKRT
jgi:hypothetical protein